MAKKGQTFKAYTPEFKLEVAKAYLSCEYGGYKGVARNFKVGKTRVEQWVKIYRAEGAEGFLVDGRGKHNNNKGRPKQIKLEDMSLEEQVEYLKMENDILKKAQALLKN